MPDSKPGSADLYLSFACLFQRPDPDYANHFEEALTLWEQEIPSAGELVNDLRKLCQEYPPGEDRLNFFWEHYIPLFETGRVEAPPYASVYLDGEGLVMGRETLAVQAFYQTAGYTISDLKQELPDHLAVELEFAAVLAQAGKPELLKEFRQQHLLPFLRLILPRITGSKRPLFPLAAQVLSLWQLG